MSDSKTINGKLVKKILIEGIITARTGLHIGGSNMGMSIGGADATVVRNPLDNKPYIPGSSLKGKMRSLLERMEGKEPPKEEKLANPMAGRLFIADADHVVAKIFGITPEDLKKQKKEDRPVSRLIVRDSPMTDDTAEKLQKAKNTDMPYTEVKTEVVIDRITSAATPRQMERVPAGAEFKLNIVLNLFDGDDETKMIAKVFEGLLLVQNDYLGGKGSRGSGQVEFSIAADGLKYKDKKHYEGEGNDWTSYIGNAKVPKEMQKEHQAAQKAKPTAA